MAVATNSTGGASAPEARQEIERAKETGIRFVQLQFTDVIGHVKAVTIPIHQLEGSVNHGTWFDGSSIEARSLKFPGRRVTARAARRA